jgi:glucose/arabinose dehydrogenase
MSESTAGIAAESGGAIHAPQAGHLYRLDRRNGAAKDVADVGDQMIQFTKDHPNADEPKPDSNPFGVLVIRDRGRVRTFVADAGANTLVEVLRGGRARVVALFPNGALRDAVPTCVAQGPDGALYVSQLLLAENFTFGGHQSNVYRVDPNASFPTPPTVWATGLTTVTGCTFDDHGNFWAAEMFGPNGAPPFGDLVRIPFRHPNRLQRLGGGGAIPLPGMIAQGPDGALYVTTNSSAPGRAGQVVRVSFGDR